MGLLYRAILILGFNSFKERFISEERDGNGPEMVNWGRTFSTSLPADERLGSKVFKMFGVLYIR